MFITPAYAQATGGLGGLGELGGLLPLVLIFVIFYFFLIRPQQKRLKAHKAMVGNLRRGDTVVTAGGLIGKVTKIVDDHEAVIELSENNRVRVVRATIAEVRTKSEPANDAAND